VAYIIIGFGPCRGKRKGYTIFMKKTIVHLLVFAFLLSGCTTTPPASSAVSDEQYYAKGMMEMGRKYFSEAQKHFEDLREKFPLSPYAIQALLRMGECQYLQKNYIEAQYQFNNFRRLHPSNAEVSYSMFMAGMCQFKQVLNHERDQTAARATVTQMELLLEVFPNSAYAGRALCKIAEAKQHIAEYEFFVGNFYLKQNNYLGAYARFDQILLKYPNAIDRDKVLLSMAKACLYDGQVEKGTRILQLLIDTYPETDNAAEVTRLQGMY
jgi:outer membrane protein assembly factor BamD